MREQRLTKIVKQYDKDLVIKRGDDGKLWLMRKTIRWHSYLLNGQVIHCSSIDLVAIFPLTADFSPKGTPVDMGIEYLIARIKEIDAHRSEEILDRINDGYHKAMAAKEKKLDGDIEDLAREAASTVKYDFRDFATSSMKSEDPRKKIENKLKMKGL